MLTSKVSDIREVSSAASGSLCPERNLDMHLSSSIVHYRGVGEAISTLPFDLQVKLGSLSFQSPSNWGFSTMWPISQSASLASFERGTEAML